MARPFLTPADVAIGDVVMVVRHGTVNVRRWDWTKVTLTADNFERITTGYLMDRAPRSRRGH